MTSATPRRLYKHERAKQDLISIYAYLLGRSSLVAQRFLEDSHRAFDLILEMPGIGHRLESSISSLQDLRVTAVSRRFRKYLIFYRPVTDGIRIITIVHGARDVQPLLESLRIEDELSGEL